MKFDKERVLGKLSGVQRVKTFSEAASTTELLSIRSLVEFTRSRGLPRSVTERSSVAGSRGFYWFTTSPPVSRKTTPPSPPAVKSFPPSPGESIRCQLESVRNLLSEVYGHATPQQCVMKVRWHDGVANGTALTLPRYQREFRKAKKFCFGMNYYLINCCRN